jgi:Domain of unknown function (DUF4173)
MMQGVLSAGLRGIEWGRTAVSLLAILFSASLAAVVFQIEQPGSVLALCFVLPFAIVLLDWFAHAKSLQSQLLPLMAGLSLLGVALEPGWLNVSLTWALLAATAIAARGSLVLLALPLVAALGRMLVSAAPLLFREGKSGVQLVQRNAQHVPRPALTSLLLPVVAVAVFTLLLATANPVIERMLLTLHFDRPWQIFTSMMDAIFSWAGVVFVMTALLLWPILRGQTVLREISVELDGITPLWHRLFFKPATVAITLLLLNLLFATENALDIWHVWMKSALPDAMTHAAYVHRGSYTLIATAILAGLLMVFALWKGTAAEQSPLVRLLVYLWTAQNLLLVASSAKRTLDYIDAYGWTEWRLAGLLWMALVFFGLACIIWRVAADKDSRWLVNVNLLAATLLLTFCAVTDMRGFIAQKNLETALVEPSRSIDFEYLSSLGPSSMEPLQSYAVVAEHNLDNAARPPVGYFALHKTHRAIVVATMLKSASDFRNSDWRSWTWRFSSLPTGTTP